MDITAPGTYELTKNVDAITITGTTGEYIIHGGGHTVNGNVFITMGGGQTLTVNINDLNVSVIRSTSGKGADG